MAAPQGARPRLMALLAGATSGGLYALSLPKADLGGLAWICLLPMLLWLLRSPPGGDDVFLAGWSSGLTAGAGRVYWIAETLGRYGGLDAAASISTTCLLVAYLALYPGLFLWLCCRCRGAGLAFPWLAASLWVLLDWVQTWMISGFPWALLGTTQYRSGPVLQVAALAGVHGLTFLLVFVNASLALALSRRRVLVLAPAALLAGLALLYGQQRLTRLAQESAGSGSAALRIGVVQGNIRQDLKWEARWRGAATGRYIDLTHRLLATASGLDLVVWPETALPFRLDDPRNAAHLRSVRALARDADTPLLVGSLGTRAPSGRDGVFNRSFLLDGSGAVAGSADKVHLVPFGEYLPFPWLFGYLDELTAQSGAFDPGPAHRALPLPGEGADRFGVFICYESIFPAIPRALVRDGAGFLVNTTNDAWFGTTAAPYQHFAMAVLRAVETGRPVVRAANTGISGLIGADGAVQAASGLFTTELMPLSVRPRAETTPYVRHGDVVLVLAALLLTGAGAGAARRRRRRVLAEMETARAELESFARAPAPLQRPLVVLPGYDSPPEALEPLRAALGRTVTDPGRLLVADLRYDEPLAVLAARTAAVLPEEPCDVIGHSLGGLVGAWLAVHPPEDGAAPRRVVRVFALAAPFGGTCWAPLGARLRFPLPRLLRDLGPRSPALDELRRRVRDRAPGWLRQFHLNGDPLRPGLDVELRSYDVPLGVGPLRRHRAVHRDPRVLRDLAAALRGQGPGKEAVDKAHWGCGRPWRPDPALRSRAEWPPDSPWSRALSPAAMSRPRLPSDFINGLLVPGAE